MNETLSPYGAVRPPSKPSPGHDAAVWTALILAALVCAAIAVVAVGYCYLAYSAGCDQVADAATVWAGMRALLVVLAVAALPWVVSWVCSVRYRVAVGVAGVIATAPVLVGLAIGLGGGAWDNGWCF